jgi:hypothetical protein
VGTSGDRPEIDFGDDTGSGLKPSPRHRGVTGPGQNEGGKPLVRDNDHSHLLPSAAIHSLHRYPFHGTAIAFFREEI